MTNLERAVTPRRKVEGWLQNLNVSERTREVAAGQATASRMAAARMEETRLTAIRMAAAARSARPRVAATPIIPSRVSLTSMAPSPVEVTSAQNMMPPQNPPGPSQSFDFFPPQAVRSDSNFHAGHPLTSIAPVRRLSFSKSYCSVSASN